MADSIDLLKNVEDADESNGVMDGIKAIKRQPSRNIVDLSAGPSHRYEESHPPPMPLPATTPMPNHERSFTTKSAFIIFLKITWQIVLFVAVFLRCDLISFVYFVALCLHKFSFLILYVNIKRQIVINLLLYSSIVMITRTIFQITAIFVPIDTSSTACQLFGIVKINNVAMIFIQVVPDLSVLVWSVIMYVLKIYRHNPNLDYRPRKHSRAAGYIAACLIIIYMLVCLLSATMSPNILSFVYSAYIIAEICLWAVVSLPSVTNVIRWLIVCYNLLHISILYFFQFPIIQELQTSSYMKQLFGLYAYSKDSTWNEIVYVFSVVLISLIISTHGHICCRYRLSKSLFPFTKDLGVIKYFFHQKSTQDDREELEKSIVGRLGDYILRNGSRVSTIVTLAFSLTFPCYLTLPLLLWSLATILLPHRWFYMTIQATTIYLSAFILLDNLWTIVPLSPVAPDLGLTPTYFLLLTLQYLLLFLFALVSYPWDTSSDTVSSLTATSSFIESLVSKRHSIASIETADQQEQAGDDDVTDRISKWQKFKDLLEYTWSSVYEFVLCYAYTLSLVVVFVCGLQTVNIINTLFLLFALIFLIFPQLARMFWLALVLYTEIVLLLQFIWQFQFTPSPIRLWGLDRQNNLWYQCRYYLIILLFTIVQLNTYKLLTIRSHTTSMIAEKPLPKHVQESWLRKGTVSIKALLMLSIKEYLQVICYLVFAFICLLKPVTLFDVGYLVIFFCCLLCHQLRQSQLIDQLWLIPCLYSASVLCLCYLYQFEDIQQLLSPLVSTEFLQDLGLIATSGSQLISYLLQHILCLFLSILQYSNIKASLRQRDRDDNIKDLFLVKFIQRLCVIHLSKLIYLLTFYACVSIKSVVGLTTIFYLLLIISYPPTLPKTRLLFILWIEALMVLQLLYQLSFMQQIVSPYTVQIQFWIGLRKFPEEQMPIEYLYWSVCLIFTLALQIHSRRQWKRGHDNYPVDERQWPLLDVPDHGNLEKLSINYYFSNLFNIISDETLMFTLGVTIFSKIDSLVGVLYFVYLLLLLVLRKGSRNNKFIILIVGIVLTSLLILFQYSLFINLFPFLPPALIINYQTMTFEPDFYLMLIICACLLKHNFTDRFWASVEDVLEIDFTPKPRSKINQLRFVFIRYFFWLPIFFTFVYASSMLNLCGFVYLLFALYFISIGERSIQQNTVWSFFLYFTIFSILLELLFYICNTVFQFDLSSNWIVLIGLNPSQISRDIFFTMFFTALVQQKINNSKSLLFVCKFIELDTELAWIRAKDHQLRSRAQLQMQQMQYNEQVEQIKEKVNSGSTDLSLIDVDDWKRLFGKREDEYGYSIIDRNDDGRYDVVDYDNEDPIIEYRIDRKYHKLTSIRKRSKFKSRGSIPKSLNDGMVEEENEVAMLEFDEEERQKKAKEILMRQNWFYHSIDSLIKLLFYLAIEYTDLYTTSSQQQLNYTSGQESRIWALIRGLYYALCAHTGLLAYVAVLINQMYHGNILSLIPTLSVLLVAFCQRPYPTRRFWQFLIIYVELTIFLKFFFNFPVWEFNKLPDCSDPEYLSRFVYIMGINQSCSPFLFESIITEIVVLFCCIVHRSIMKRLGLWKAQEINMITAPLEPSQSDQNNNESSVNSSVEDLVINWKDQTPIKRWYHGFVANIINYFDINQQLPGKDYYLGMFIADLIVFVLTIIFWTSFSGDYRLNSNLEFLYSVFNQNTVPPLFAAIIIISFCLILADRAIYTAKSLPAKYVMHVITCLVYIFWIFFILPLSNRERFRDMPSLQLWFFCKCIYWYFSGLQIKSGYPQMRVSNFLMRSYSNLNRIGFIIFRAIPFLWELRTIVDWTLTKTTLDLYNWLKFEDIFANIYLVKAAREYEKENPRRFGEVQNKFWKRFNGCLMLFGLVALLWFPLILLSIPGTTKMNPIKLLRVRVQITGFEAFYDQSLPKAYIQNMTVEEYVRLKQENPSLFPSYMPSGLIQKATLDPSSEILWQITPPSRDRLSEMLNSTTGTSESVYLYTEWELEKDEPSLPQITRGYQLALLSTDARRNLSLAVNASAPGIYETRISNVYPLFLRAFPNGPVSNLAPDNQKLVNCSLNYVVSASGPNNSSTSGWWNLYQISPEGTYSSPTFQILSDNVPAISTLSSYGIIGLYVAVVFAAGRFIRILITDLTLRIMYEDLPHPDSIVQLCSDVVLAREFGYFETEETLYWQLITLFRSPRLLFDKSRMPKEYHK